MLDIVSLKYVEGVCGFNSGISMFVLEVVQMM
jgi:hypothetical protein